MDLSTCLWLCQSHVYPEISDTRFTVGQSFVRGRMCYVFRFAIVLLFRTGGYLGYSLTDSFWPGASINLSNTHCIAVGVIFTATQQWWKALKILKRDANWMALNSVVKTEGISFPTQILKGAQQRQRQVTIVESNVPVLWSYQNNTLLIAISLANEKDAILVQRYYRALFN